MKLVTRINKIFLICSLILLLSIFFDWFTTLFYFQHLEGFEEGNMFVAYLGVPLELAIIPQLWVFIVMFAFFYVLNLKTESPLIEATTLSGVLIVPFLSTTAPLFNFVLVQMKIHPILSEIIRFGTTALLTFLLILVLVRSKIIIVKR